MVTNFKSENGFKNPFIRLLSLIEGAVPSKEILTQKHMWFDGKVFFGDVLSLKKGFFYLELEKQQTALLYSWNFFPNSTRSLWLLEVT